jgi:hypothetical protein
MPLLIGRLSPAIYSGEKRRPLSNPYNKLRSKDAGIIEGLTHREPKTRYL